MTELQLPVVQPLWINTIKVKVNKTRSFFLSFFFFFFSLIGKKAIHVMRDVENIVVLSHHVLQDLKEQGNRA
jgi:hypothetical protein